MLQVKEKRWDSYRIKETLDDLARKPSLFSTDYLRMIVDQLDPSQRALVRDSWDEKARRAAWELAAKVALEHYGWES